MNTTTRNLLRNIEDAKARLRHYRVIFVLLVLAFTVFAIAGVGGVLMGVLSAGTGHDYGGPAATCIMVGLLGGSFTGGFISWWWRLHHIETRPRDENGNGGGEFYAGPPSRHVTAALRAHEDHVMEGVS